MTLAVITLVASLLLVRTLYNLERLEPGFELDDLGLAQIALLSSDSATVARRQAAGRAAGGAGGRAPGRAGSDHGHLTRPLSGTAGWDYGFIAEGQTDAQAAANPYLNYEAILPNYFETLRLPILRGRSFEAADREGSPLVVIVSQAMAQTDLAWPGPDRQAPSMGR